ncbi:FMN-binding protein [Micromonospora sp. RTGN7]|uniref:FMN-binding protein n=1 Tax=Micromonospora sp. RTGN7 TaxID=3016526 RepID=UPI0029FF0341|nr:FMN-binding protein [Micromonospora sp. RTGN7]
MRRVLLAITGLAAGTTALVVLKGSPQASQVAQNLPAAPSSSAVPSLSATGSSSAAPTTGAATPRPRATATRAPGSRTSASARPSTARPSSAPRTTTAAPPKSTTRTVTGTVVSNEYGNVQVQIVVSGDRIVRAVALELPQKFVQSERRNEEVEGRYSGTSGQVVQRQSADLDTVSGATATSNSYRQSLQAAIDRAG